MEDSAFKLCPFCKQQIRREAIKCRFCGEWLESSEAGPARKLLTADRPAGSTKAVGRALDETYLQQRPANPPPIPDTQNKTTPKASAKTGGKKDRYPKWLIVVLTSAALIGFLVGIVVNSHRSYLDILLGSLGGAVGCSAAAGYVASIVICGLKNKPFFMVIGLLAPFAHVGAPAISLWPIIGAIRIAKPDSTYAKKYYGDLKMGISARRFPPAPKKMRA